MKAMCLHIYTDQQQIISRESFCGEKLIDIFLIRTIHKHLSETLQTHTCVKLQQNGWQLLKEVDPK